jgi:hypothetical protein
MHAFVPALFKRVRGWGEGEEVLCMVYGIQGQHTRVMVESEGWYTRLVRTISNHTVQPRQANIPDHLLTILSLPYLSLKGLCHEIEYIFNFYTSTFAGLWNHKLSRNWLTTEVEVLDKKIELSLVLQIYVSLMTQSPKHYKQMHCNKY